MRKNLSILTVLFLLAHVAYSDSINVEWVKQFTGKTDRNDLTVKTDSEGFIYIAGTFTSGSQGTEWKLIKLSPNSDTLFSRSFNSSGNGNDFLNAMELDQFDNLYLSGRFFYSDAKTQFSTIKLDKDGQLQWQFNSDPIDGTYEGNYIQIDTSSNVYVGGNIINGNNSDLFIFKLDAAGDSLWRYRAGTDNNRIVKGLKLFDGKIIAAGDIYRNSSWDILLVGLNHNGALQFEEYYNGRSNGDDMCNDITVDDNNIYFAGYSTNNGTKDYVTIKFAADGRIQWYALFDDSQKDDEAVSIIKFDDLIVVTGNVLTGQSVFEHTDIVTIAYDSRGVQVWRQKFNGRHSGNDIAVRLKNNVKNEILVGGYSWSNQTNYDSYLLNYDINGDIVWTHSSNDSASGDNFLSEINIDFLGNAYIASYTVGSSSVRAELIKVNQPDKFIYVLKDYLKTLTVGLLDASTDSIVKHFVYESCANAADSLFFITYPALIDSCTANGYNLKEAMNAKISDFFNLPSRDHVDFIFKRLWVMGNRYSPLLIVLHYSHFSQIELESNPKLTYTYEENDYPILCLNCEGGTIDKAGTESNVTWGTFLTANPLVYVNGDPSIYITNCIFTLSPNISDRCMVCPGTGTWPLTSGQGSSTQNHEIDITLGYNQSSLITDNCYDQIIAQSSLFPASNPSNYGRLSRIGNLPYYSVHATGLPNYEKRIKKVLNPIQDRQYKSYQTGNTDVTNDANWLDGDVLSLCFTNTLFNSIGELNQRYALAHGLYKIDRPGINQKPVYFVFPYGQGVWYSQGPDMGIFYGLDEDIGIYCPSGKRKMSEDYKTKQCEFCAVAPLTIELPIGITIWDYLATTDFSTINDYWSESAISVGFRTNFGNTLTSGLTGTPGLNLHDFYAVSNPIPCTPPSSNLICSFELFPGNEYQYERNFFNNLTLAPSEDVTIYIKANFNNGTSINECRTVTLIDNNPQFPNTPFKNVVIIIRGDIKDYNSSVVNYLVEIYE